jgi:hypothetical protein
MATAKRATTSFSAVVGDVEYIVHAGVVFPGDHPVVEAHPELFGPAVVVAEAPVEQATPAPGEKRQR